MINIDNNINNIDNNNEFIKNNKNFNNNLESKFNNKLNNAKINNQIKRINQIENKINNNQYQNNELINDILKKFELINNNINLIINKTNKLELNIDTLLKYQNKIYNFLEIDNILIENNDNNLIINNDNNDDNDNINNNILKMSLIKDIKIEKFNIDNNLILKFLLNNDIIGDVNLFKLLYLDNVPKHLYPIQYNGKKTFKYWYNNTWNIDSNGNYIKNTILANNIYNIYLKLNQIEIINNIDQFINNQTHILKLSDIKYQDKWLNQIKDLLN